MQELIDYGAENGPSTFARTTLPHGLGAIESPAWRWAPGFFRPHAAQQTSVSHLTSYVGAV